MTPLQTLQAAISLNERDAYPPVLQLAFQIFSLAQTMGGQVYYGAYGSIGPQFTPNTPGAIAIDSVTLRQWQFSGGIWT
jgi:hypothetical protein